MRGVLLFAVAVVGPISAKSDAPPIPCHPEKVTLKGVVSGRDKLSHFGGGVAERKGYGDFFISV